MRRLIVPSALAVLGLGAAFALLRSGTPPRPGTPLHPGALPVLVTERARVRVVTLTDGLNQPWALAFLPGGDMLITERVGRMRLMHDGRLASGSIGGLPAVDTRMQDGLMDLALHPRFVQNRLLYFTYSKPGERGDTTALASAKFDGATLTDVRDLFVADAWSTPGGNSGSRIAFGLDGRIYNVGRRAARAGAGAGSAHAQRQDQSRTLTWARAAMCANKLKVPATR